MMRSVYSGQNGWFAPLTKMLTALKQRGVGGVVKQLYLIGDLKFGELKGTDNHGNKYYENVNLPYGQHRWVEYADIHNPDPTMIHPDWHGWMHHMFDHTPLDEPTGVSIHGGLPLSQTVHSIYGHNLGKTKIADHDAQYNTSQYRQRGYNIGSLMTAPGDENKYYLQPGHPLHPLAAKGGKFAAASTEGEWVPPSDAKLYTDKKGARKL